MQKMLRRKAGALALAAIGAGLAAAAPPAGAQAAEALKVLDRDHILGKREAPITIIEYASLTCPHCREFHTSVVPELKKAWIDPGRARLVYRDYPLDRLALQAAQIAECSGEARYFGIIDLLFQTQEKWATARDPIAEIGRILRIAGISEADIKACLADEKKGNETVLADYESGEKAGVTGTPTLYINGEKYNGSRLYADIDAYLQKLGK